MPAAVARTILSFQPDGDTSSESAGAPADWVAQLDCGHRRHIRHRPPLSSYPWINDPTQRDAHVGEQIECGRCLQRVWPEQAEPYKTTKTFTQDTVPAGLLGEHKTAPRIWGRLEVLSGGLQLRFVDPLDELVAVTAGEWAAIPPELVHRVELTGPVEFHVVFCRLGEPPPIG